MTQEKAIYVDEETGEILEKDIIITKNGLYAPLGIPAYNVLARAKEHAAKDVLVALMSFRHAGDNHVWPSQSLLMRQTGRGKAKVIEGTKVLKEFGFIKVKKVFDGKLMHNHYFIQDSCYYTELLNEKARSFVVPVGSCLVCGKTLFPGDFKKNSDSYAHWRCSGNIAKIGAKSFSPMPRKNAVG
jgi:hypothetical protein